MICNFIVCFGEDYIKIWDIDLGELKLKEQINKCNDLQLNQI